MNKLITVLLTICMSSSVFAWGQYKKPQISEVFVDQELNQLTIRGSDFQNPDVSLGEYGGFLTYVSSTGDYEWVVELPAKILDGDYKLTLSQGWRGYYRDDFDLTIGAVGPPGPPGADSVVPGPQGPPGADSIVPGPRGPQGLIDLSKIYRVEKVDQGDYNVSCNPGDKAIACELFCNRSPHLISGGTNFATEEKCNGGCRDVAGNTGPPYIFTVVCVKN